MNHGSLFSGIGGFDLAAEWMGWNNIFHCEWNTFGQRVLKYYWPKAISYGDITKTDFTIHRGTIDILTGGFPCQPYSVAGKRKGKEDERHLWPEMLRAIREVQPRWIVGENVPGLLNWNGGLVLNEIKTDLESAGFEVFPSLILPACGKNAPHRRDRVWIVAYSEGNSIKHEDRNERLHAQAFSEKRLNESIAIANTNNQRLQGSAFDRASIERGENGNKFTSRFLCTDWQEFPTQSPIRIGNDGLPSKLDGITISDWIEQSIKAGGNAIVPQVVFEIFKVLEKMSNG